MEIANPLLCVNPVLVDAVDTTTHTANFDGDKSKMLEVKVKEPAGDKMQLGLFIIFSRPTLTNLKQFLIFHPHLPTNSKTGAELPFMKANIQEIYIEKN